MEPLDRYLQSVKKHLPWQRQEDIVAELRANLESQLEDREAALGRPLTPAEAEAWIKSLGSPLEMAAPYQPQQYLIGPAVFPTYRQVLKLACTWGLIIYCISTAVQLMAASVPSADDLVWAFLRLPMVLIQIAAWCTLVFAAFEFAVAHRYVDVSKLGPFCHNWPPVGLPPLDVAGGAPGGKKPRSFAQAVAEAVFAFLGLVWLLLLPRHHWLIFGPGAAYLDNSPYRLSPLLVSFYWCVIAVNVVQIGLHIENLWHGRWQRASGWQRIVRQVLALVPLVPVFAIPGHAFILLKHPAEDAARLGPTLDAFNDGVYKFVLFISAITVLQLLWTLGRTGMNAYRRRVAA